jgi:hypothetical protein
MNFYMTYFKTYFDCDDIVYAVQRARSLRFNSLVWVFFPVLIAEVLAYVALLI